MFVYTYSMIEWKQLKRRLKAGPVSFSELRERGMSQYDINNLLKAEKLLRVEKGVYQLAEQDYSEYAQAQAASLQMGQPCAVCLISALSHHGLTDNIPNKVWLFVPENKPTAHQNIRAVRSRSPRWDVGIMEEEGFKMTNLERTVIDAFRYKRIVGLSTATEALRRALQGKKTNVNELYDMAKKLKYSKQISPYLEAYI